MVAQDALHAAPSTLPVSLPSSCSVYHLYPNPVASILAVELDCGSGPAVLFLDLELGQTLNLADTLQIGARFLAWSTEGRFAYLKQNPLTDPQIIRVDRLSNDAETLPLPVTLYNLAALTDGDIVYSVTQGIGFGSEIWQADSRGRHRKLILEESLSIVAYLRPSPDGTKVAFIRFPDTQTPFPAGALWLMDADGSNPHYLADADAGHGYAPAWSPDGAQIAFVVRENPDDPQVSFSAGALKSNVYLFDIQSSALTPVTTFNDAVVETPVWSPDGTVLLFNVLRDDTISVWFEDAVGLRSLSEEVTCCAVWVPGR